MTKHRGYGGKSVRRLPSGLGSEWSYTLDGIAWTPAPGVEYRIDEDKSPARLGWRACYFARGADYGEVVSDFKDQAIHAADAADEHWSATRGNA